MSLKNKSVLVTGGAGFIGSHLVDALVREEPEKIIVVDNFFLGKNANLEDAQANCNYLKVYNQDATDYEKMKTIAETEGIDVIFDLAVIPLPTSLEKPEWTFRHNMDMTLTVCKLMKNDLSKTLIHFSSSEAYGTTVSGPMDENHPLNGTTPYAASKASSDLLILSYSRTFGIDASIIRPFNNYGPRQNEKSYAGVIPLTIKRIIDGETPIIFGDGKQTRDYLFVTDTANAAIKIYNKNITRNKVLNIASGSEISIQYLIELIMKNMESNKKIIYQPERIGDVKRHIANTYLAKDLIGFNPTISIEEGLKKTIEWYKKLFFIKNKNPI